MEFSPILARAAPCPIPAPAKPRGEPHAPSAERPAGEPARRVDQGRVARILGGRGDAGERLLGGEGARMSRAVVGAIALHGLGEIAAGARWIA